MKKVIVSLILAVFLITPIFISAQTAPTQEQLTQQLIQVLTQLIAQLEQEIASIIAQRAATTPAPSPILIPAATSNTPLKGTIDLKQSTTYQSQSIIAPQSNFKLADFSLTNNTTDAINLNKIEADLAVDSNPYITNLYVANLYITYGSNKTAILNTATGNNYWTINFQLAIGQTIDLSVYGDVNSSIPLNSIISSS